uniref:Uncharacterized protein n=1 Tax=Parascaris univalens TaxID=6257 RepID=A0A914ZTT7_PARUN
MRAVFLQMLLVAAVECVEGRTSVGLLTNEYPIYVHTFDTEQLCRAQCQVECFMHHIDDLMMQRWLCPLKQEEKNEPEPWYPFEDASLGLPVVVIVALGAVAVVIAAFCILGIVRRRFSASVPNDL